jgi:hypothetical protein
LFDSILFLVFHITLFSPKIMSAFVSRAVH